MKKCIKISTRISSTIWGHTTENYYHFINHLLSPFFDYLEKNNLQIEQVLLCPNISGKYYYNMILDEFGINQCYQDCESLEIQIEKYRNEKPLINFIEKYKNLKNLKTKTNNKIVFIKRKPDGRRIIINEQEIIEKIKTLKPDYDVLDVYFDDFSFIDQVKIVSDCKLLIGAHGAGLTNLIFMNERTSVLELFPEKWQGAHFYNMCASKQIKYYKIEGKTPGLSQSDVDEFYKVKNSGNLGDSRNKVQIQSKLRDAKFTISISELLEKIKEITSMT